MKKLFQRKAVPKGSEEEVSKPVGVSPSPSAAEVKATDKKTKAVVAGSPAPAHPASDPAKGDNHKNACHCCGRKVGLLQFAAKKKLKLHRCKRCQQKVCSSCSTRSICAKCKIKYESRSKLHSPADVARLSGIEMERLMYALDIEPAPVGEHLATDIFNKLEQQCTLETLLTSGGDGEHHPTASHEHSDDGEVSDEECRQQSVTDSGPSPATPADGDSGRVLPTEVESLSRITSAAYFETLSLAELRRILDEFQVQYDEGATWQECVRLVVDLWLSYVDLGSTSSDSGSICQSVSLRDIIKADDINALDVDSLRTLLDNHDIDYNDCWIKWELAYRVKRLWTILNADARTEGELENNLCVSCLCSPINSTVFPCSHKATCLPCGRDLLRCPICCGAVDKVMPFAVARRTAPNSSGSSISRAPPPPPPLKPSSSFR